MFFCNLIFSQSSKIKQLESQRLLIKKEIENINSLLFDNSKTTKIAYNDLENISIKVAKNEELIKLTNQQINIVTTEMVIFELLENSKNDHFKKVTEFIK